MNKLIKLIENNDSFVLFRHVNPDGDALGSQCGLANFIMENYPDKKVYTMGERGSGPSFFPKNVLPSDEALSNSIAIVLDSATLERIDGPYDKAKFIFNIDHHPSIKPYGDDTIVEVYRSSTCEIVANLLLETNKVSKETASYLLAGILTDTNQFSTENTGPETLTIASKLMECGAQIDEIVRVFFSRSYEDLVISGDFINHIEFSDGLACLTITNQMRETYGLSVQKAKLYNSVMANIKGFDVYAIFVERDEGGYSASLRSKDVTINSICEMYGGGGHRLACGIHTLTLEDLESLKIILKEAIKKHDQA